MTRKTPVADETQWRKHLQRSLARIRSAMDKFDGFEGVDYFWGAANDGSTM